jgi:hypothetical protein
MMPKVKKSVKAQVTAGREIKYPEVTSDVCRGSTAISADDAKELLGWEDAPEGKTYCREVFSLTKIRCQLANMAVVRNRPLSVSRLLTLKQDILQRRWRLNGETIIVGCTGQLLNGQHSLLALILAVLDWERDRDRWGEFWTTPPVIDKVVVSGVEESDEVINTMDTCKPRSLYDVLCRSEYFASLKEGERRAMSRMTDYAIRLLWHRTGAFLDAFAPRRTHAESLAFLGAHPKLMDAVRHCHEENGKEGRIACYMSPGYAAGLLYLMGSSASDPSAYRSSAHPDESTLDWSRWSDACDFLVLLAARDPKLSAVRGAMASYLKEGRINNAERWGIIAKAWLLHSTGDPVTAESLELLYEETNEGIKKLVDYPSVGGIDLGDPSSMDEANVVMDDPTPAAIAEETKKMKTKSSEPAPTASKPKKIGSPKKAGPNWAKGDIAWVRDHAGEHFVAELVEDPWDCDDNECRALVRTARGEEWDVLYDDLSLENPSTGKISEKVVGKTVAAKTRAKPKMKGWEIGDRPWVESSDGETWRGRIVELTKSAAKVKVETGHQGAGSTKTVDLQNLRRQQTVRQGAA